MYAFVLVMHVYMYFDLNVNLLTTISAANVDEKLFKFLGSIYCCNN